jgi:hypothetical protein
MKPIAVLVGISIISWIAAVALAGSAAGLEILFGMLGPLAATTGTWLLVAWSYRRHPEQLTQFMGAAFIVKAVFFGIYFGVMLRVMKLRPVPFVTSFVCYFIGLYLIEAFYLKRLFSERSR